MIISTKEFMDLKLSHIKPLLNYALSIEDEISIIAKTDKVDFNPKLPEHISSAFKEIILFELANYTLQSAHIQNDDLIFEAGFGEENFGSLVTVPLDSILQINIDQTPIYVNPAAILPKPKKEEKPKNPFELNPRNKKFMGG